MDDVQKVNGWLLLTGCGSDTGLKRQSNQDRLLMNPDIGFFSLADGMGGHSGGEIAAGLALETLHQNLQTLSEDLSPRAKLLLGFAASNKAIFEKAEQDTSLQGMGTTGVVAWFYPDRKLYIGSVGDSRCYLANTDGFWQLTIDHSLVEEKRRAGLITREMMNDHQPKNVLTRSIGYDPSLEVDVFELDPRPGDLFLLCSDGLTGMLSDKEIKQILQPVFEQKQHPQETARELIDAAKRSGGLDNISVSLVFVLEQT
jgi:PPM family protein phosphatase